MHSVVAAFGKLMSAARGEVLCSVTTAKVCNSCQNYMLFALSCVCSMVLLDDFFFIFILSFRTQVTDGAID